MTKRKHRHKWTYDFDIGAKLKCALLVLFLFSACGNTPTSRNIQLIDVHGKVVRSWKCYNTSIGTTRAGQITAITLTDEIICVGGSYFEKPRELNLPIRVYQ